MRAQLKRRHKYSLVLTCNLLPMVSRSRFSNHLQTHLQKILRIYISVQIETTTCRDNFKNGWATWGFESSNFSCLQDNQGTGSCWNDISKIFKASSNSKTLWYSKNWMMQERCPNEITTTNSQDCLPTSCKVSKEANVAIAKVSIPYNIDRSLRLIRFNAFANAFSGR